MELNLEEALRYAGVPSPPPEELRREVAEVAAQMTRSVTPRWRWRLFELEHTPEGPYLPELNLLLPGRTAALMLKECTQAALLACLDTQRILGLYVTDSCLLNPGKSVTAIVGVSDRPQMARVRGCRYCSMNQTCQLRKGGKSCGLS